MRSARVHADIAADGAGELAGWIGRVEESHRRDGVRYAQIGDAGFDANVAALEIRLQHAIHPRQTQDDRIFRRKRASRERRTGPARHHADLAQVAKPQNGAHFLGRSWQNNGHRQTFVCGQRIGFEGSPASFVRHHGAARKQLLQCIHELITPCQDLGLRLDYIDSGHRTASKAS
jgi:hypothetical protein